MSKRTDAPYTRDDYSRYEDRYHPGHGLAPFEAIVDTRRLESTVNENVFLRAQIAALRAGYLEIRRGKKREDNKHPLGEYFSMVSRFSGIAQAALLLVPGER